MLNELTNVIQTLKRQFNMDFGHSFCKTYGGYMYNPFVHDSQDGGIDGISGCGAKPSHPLKMQRQNQNMMQVVMNLFFY